MKQNIKLKELKLTTTRKKKQCLASFSRYKMLTRLLELLVLCPVSLSAKKYTKINLEIRKKTRIFNFYRRTVHYGIYTLFTQKQMHFYSTWKSLKFTLKYTSISLLHVSVFGHPQGACTEPG